MSVGPRPAYSAFTPPALTVAVRCRTLPARPSGAAAEDADAAADDDDAADAAKARFVARIHAFAAAFAPGPVTCAALRACRRSRGYVMIVAVVPASAPATNRVRMPPPSGSPIARASAAL
eukprot:29243-Pelagococcus_subviridis.AAC.12